MAAVLWCGGEDIDFPNGAGTMLVATGGGAQWRPGFARCAVSNSNATTANQLQSLSFSGGSVTSCWLHCTWNPAAAGTSKKGIGLGLNGTAGGLVIGTDSTSAQKLALWKLSSGTFTELASETGVSIPGSNSNQLDMHLQNHGATATVDVYLNGVKVISFSGSTAITGIAAFDSVLFYANTSWFFSEIIVTDSLDTRNLSLLTNSPNAAGTTNNWTGAFTDINETTLNDATLITVNTTAKDFQANVVDLPAGSFKPLAVKEIARMNVLAGSVPTSVKLGVNMGGTVNVDAGHTLSTTLTQFERLMLTNPVSAAAWTTSDINSMQIDCQSA